VIFWHLGATTAIVRYTFRDERMDLRMLALGALLPDLVDTPAGALFYSSLGSVRLVAHTLLASAVAMVLVLLGTRRGRPRKRWMPLAVGMLVHLVLDGMWNDPATLWWPFLGWGFTPAGPATFGALAVEVLTDPVTWALEAAGLAYLLVLARRARLGDPGERAAFMSTGRVSVPIGR